MSGRQRTRNVMDRLIWWAHERIGEEATPLDYVVMVLENGGRLVDIAVELTEARLGDPPHPVTFGMVVRSLEMSGVPAAAVQTALNAARASGAHAKVEDAERIADSVSADRDQIAKARLRAETRQWAAERNNREAYGAKQGAQVTVNIGELHLDALRKVGPRPTRLERVEDAEVLAIESPNELAELEALLE